MTEPKQDRISKVFLQCSNPDCNNASVSSPNNALLRLGGESAVGKFEGMQDGGQGTPEKMKEFLEEQSQICDRCHQGDVEFVADNNNEIYLSGMAAYASGIPAEDNPHPERTLERRLWQVGREDAFFAVPMPSEQNNDSL